MIRFSVVITAYNEENKIEECLKSVGFADEIILINNSSTDKTIEIAKRYTSNIFTKPNYPMLNINKNFGFSKANGEWILNLDADERVTPELEKEIKSEIQQPKSEINGYWIPRKNIIFGKWIKHTGWYPDHQLRLFKKGKGQFPEKHIHEMIKLTGKTNYLKNPILHYNYETIEQFLNKLINIYTPNEAEQLLANGYILDLRDAIRFPAREFVSRFFAREGYKDGFHGLILSLLMAFYHFVVFVNIWQKEGFKSIEDKDLLKDIEDEFRKTNKELFFWFSKEKMKTVKSPFRRLIYRAIQKLTL